MRECGVKVAPTDIGLSQEIVLSRWPIGAAGWVTWPRAGLPLARGPLGGTCIPRNTLEDQEERLGGFFSPTRPEQCHSDAMTAVAVDTRAVTADIY